MYQRLVMKERGVRNSDGSDIIVAPWAWWRQFLGIPVPCRAAIEELSVKVVAIHHFAGPPSSPSISTTTKSLHLEAPWGYVGGDDGCTETWTRRQQRVDWAWELRRGVDNEAVRGDV